MKLQLEESIKTKCNDGKYIATVASVAMEKLRNGNTVLRVHLRFKDSDRNLVEIAPVYPQKFTKNSGFYELLMALGYDDMEIGEQIDTDDLIDEKVRIVVENVDKGGHVYSNVISYSKYVPKSQRRYKNEQEEEENYYETEAN